MKFWLLFDMLKSFGHMKFNNKAGTRSSGESIIYVNIVSRFENLATLTLSKRRAILTGSSTAYNTEEIDNKVCSTTVKLF